MDKLDFIDYVQVIALIAALLFACFPVFIDIKTDGKYNKFAILFGSLFLIALIVGVFATISKSISDKENYNSTINKLESTLNAVSINLSTSVKVLKNTESSITTLDSLQKEAVNLNEGLRQQLNQQLVTNKSAKALFDNMQLEDKKRLEGYKNNLKATFYTISNSYVYVMFPRRIGTILTKEDSLNAINKMNDFIVRTISLLNEQKYNPVLLSNIKVYNLWNDYIGILSQVQWQINGYNEQSIPKMERQLDDGTRHFMVKVSEMFMNQGVRPFEN